MRLFLLVAAFCGAFFGWLTKDPVYVILGGQFICALFILNKLKKK
jgi:hypothetical protein